MAYQKGQNFKILINIYETMLHYVEYRKLWDTVYHGIFEMPNI